MCEPITLAALGTAAIAGGYGLYRDKKADKKADKAKAAGVEAINKQYQEKIEANKIANSVQSTNTTKETPTDLATKLKQQKVPLNTTNTGATIGSPSSVGLNLGGY